MHSPENFKEYIAAFEQKLGSVVADDISTVPYIQKYLGHILQHKKYYLSIYADVLHKLIKHSPKNKAAITLIDFGSGHGLLGIFAKFCGFKKVYLNDIDGKFVDASENLAGQLNIKIDGCIRGDIGYTREYFNNKMPDAIIGTDVIEHIYDLGIFFNTIRQMNQSMVSVFTTASNPANYFKVKELKKLQLKDEWEGGKPGDNIFFGNSPLEPFLNIRERIIKNTAAELSDTKVLELAEATRGMNERDIVSAIEQYKASGKLPVPAEGTNTCDPLTGCWTERILSLEEYNRQYHFAGFRLGFYDGFYNIYVPGFKKYIKKILNTGVSILGNKVAPYIILVGSAK